MTWPREIPIDGEPADVHEIVTRNARWMASSPVPKLFVNGDPGALLTGPLREQCRRWPAQDEVTVAGLHFLPEDSAAAIADALDVWLGHWCGGETTQPYWSGSRQQLGHAVDRRGPAELFRAGAGGPSAARPSP